MRDRRYGQFCGLARAAEVIGQRWTILILRDLLVGPLRYSDLVAGLPGIPTSVLATRLKELEQDGLIVRSARSGSDRSVVYQVTDRARELVPAFDALSRWGAAGMTAPREGEVVTESSLVSALRVAAGGREGGSVAHRTYQVEAGDVVVHAIVDEDGVTVERGAHPAPDLTIVTGPGFRDLLAGTVDAAGAVATGAVSILGDPAHLEDFTRSFRVPYSPSVKERAAGTAT